MSVLHKTLIILDALRDFCGYERRSGGRWPLCLSGLVVLLAFAYPHSGPRFQTTAVMGWILATAYVNFRKGITKPGSGHDLSDSLYTVAFPTLAIATFGGAPHMTAFQYLFTTLSVCALAYLFGYVFAENSKPAGSNASIVIESLPVRMIVGILVGITGVALILGIPSLASMAAPSLELLMQR